MIIVHTGERYLRIFKPDRDPKIALEVSRIFKDNQGSLSLAALKSRIVERFGFDLSQIVEREDLETTLRSSTKVQHVTTSFYPILGDTIHEKGTFTVRPY